jgi:hypothetical protein
MLVLVLMLTGKLYQDTVYAEVCHQVCVKSQDSQCLLQIPLRPSPPARSSGSIIWTEESPIVSAEACVIVGWCPGIDFLFYSLSGLEQKLVRSCCFHALEALSVWFLSICPVFHRRCAL